MVMRPSHAERRLRLSVNTEPTSITLETGAQPSTPALRTAIVPLVTPLGIFSDEVSLLEAQ